MCPADPPTDLAGTGNMKGSGMTRHLLVLADELQPQIGSGHRWVEAKIGYKWVLCVSVQKATASVSSVIYGTLW